MKLLEVKNIDKTFYSNRRDRIIHAVEDVSFAINEGDFLGICGGSGCGKSTLAQIIMGLIRPDKGSICFKGESLVFPYKRDAYRHMQMVFQSPRESFDPRQTIGGSLISMLKNTGISKDRALSCAAELLDDVGLDKEYLIKYPHQMSGGECQRAAIARALAVKPEIMVCDEITSALDANVQAQIIRLLIKMREKMNISLIFISHDIALIQSLCDRVLVMHEGRIVEVGSVEKVLSDPSDEYTRLLIDSVINI